jgi:hypothetical protein
MDEARLRERLEQQLDEMEVLKAMFPDPRELVIHSFLSSSSLPASNSGFVVDNSTATTNVHSITRFTLYLPISSISEATQQGQAIVELECSLPLEYPQEAPIISLRSSKFSRDSQSKALGSVLDLVAQLKGEVCLIPVIQWIQENADKYFTTPSMQMDNEKQKKEEERLIREWLWFHHIYSKKKRRHIVDWARQMNLTGCSMPGKPGVICIEGNESSVREYVARIRNLSWQKMSSKLIETLDPTSLQPQPQSQQQKKLTTTSNVTNNNNNYNNNNNNNNNNFSSTLNSQVAEKNSNNNAIKRVRAFSSFDEVAIDLSLIAESESGSGSENSNIGSGGSSGSRMIAGGRHMDRGYFYTFLESKGLAHVFAHVFGIGQISSS